VTARKRLLHSEVNGDQITYDYGSTVVSFGGYMNWINVTTYPNDLILTARRVGTTVSYYINGVFLVSGTGSTNDVVLGKLFSRDTVIEQLFNSATASLQITKGTRTDAQRTADVNRLMTKYGVA